MRLSDWPKRGAQPMRIPGDPRLRPIRDFGALGFGVTSQRSGGWTRREMARRAVWRARWTGALLRGARRAWGHLGDLSEGMVRREEGVPGTRRNVRPHDPGENRLPPKLRAEGARG